MSQTTKVLIHLPVSLKKKLDAMKAQGYTASGLIRSLLERELGSTKTDSRSTKKGKGLS
jgi:hypothetical protein